MRNIIKIGDFVITKNIAKDDDYFCKIKKAGAVFAYGAFLTDFLQFLILAFVVFCLIRQLNKLIPIPKEPPKTKICPFCKSEIPHEATKCAHCTSDLPTT